MLIYLNDMLLKMKSSMAIKGREWRFVCVYSIPPLRLWLHSIISASERSKK